MKYKECLRCGYTRTPNETAPADQCPSCGAYYAKVAANQQRARKQPEPPAPASKKHTFRKILTALETAKAAPRQAQIEARASQTTLVRGYRGRQAAAIAEFQKEAAQLEQEGFEPTNQMWEPGNWGCLSFILATCLIPLFGIGLLIILGLIIVKPPGTLTVTYKRVPSSAAPR